MDNRGKKYNYNNYNKYNTYNPEGSEDYTNKEIKNESKNSILTFSNNQNLNTNSISNYYDTITQNNISPYPRINECCHHNLYTSPSIANDLRVSNLERRLENTEKMLKFYEEMLRLKEEEKKNEFRIDQNKVIELNKKVITLEEHIKFLNKRINEQNEILNEKTEGMEKKLGKFLETKNSIGDFYANKLGDLEALIKKNDILIESVIEEKLSHVQMNFDSKLEEMLNLINDIGKASEVNEFSITESKENIRMIQRDHLDFIKILSILKEKSDSLEFIMSQITELKNQYSKILHIYGEQSQEEDKFLQKILSGNENK